MEIPNNGHQTPQGGPKLLREVLKLPQKLPPLLLPPRNLRMELVTKKLKVEIRMWQKKWLQIRVR